MNDWGYGVQQWGSIRAFIKDGVTLYSQWNMVLDSTGKSGRPPPLACLTCRGRIARVDVTSSCLRNVLVSTTSASALSLVSMQASAGVRAQ